MSTLNSSIRLAQVVNDIDDAQHEIDELEGRYDGALGAEIDLRRSGASAEDITAVQETIGAVRLEISVQKGLMGALRSSQSFWVGEEKSEIEAMKNIRTGELAKG